MKSNSRKNRRAVAAPKSNPSRTYRGFSPRFVELEQRDVPAVLYVDPVNAATGTFNTGNPGEVTGLTFGTNIFDTFADAFAATQGDATADTINLSYGNITIDNSGGSLAVTAADGALSIVGSGTGATIITPNTNSVAEFGQDATVFLANGAGATLNVSNLYFDGAYPALTIGQLFRYQAGATGTISGVAASLVIFTPVGNNSGTVVVATGAGTNVTVTNSTFTDYGAAGVGVDDFANATITGNVFNGGGPGNYIIYGVQVSDGSQALISGNTFTNHLGQTGGAASAGILITGDDGSGTTFNPANATIIGNRLSGNVIGVIVGTPDSGGGAVDTSNAVINFNNIAGNDTGILTDTTTTTVVDAAFNWWGDASGPLAVANNTPAGDNATGKGNPVDDQVNWGGSAKVLPGPVPVAVAPDATTYLNNLPKAGATVTGPGTPVDVTALAFTVTFSQAVTGFDATDITVTNGTVLSVTPVGTAGTTFTVTVARAQNGNVTVTVPASTIDATTGLPTISTTSFGGTTASNTATTAFVFGNGFSAGGGSGQSQPALGVDSNNVTRAAVVPFESAFLGGVRTAVADINGDGELEVIVGSGPGRTNEVRIFNSATGGLLASFNPFETSFGGGVYVTTGDVNGDGVPEVVVTPDVTGGPRVRIMNGAAIKAQTTSFTGTLAGDVIADFFGIQDPNFFGGARAAIGDINNDGFGDVLVGAGFGGGPRIAGFDGNGITSANQVKLFADFFAFAQSASSLRDGAYLAAGDINADGFSDLIVGAGDGGGPRVSAYSGKDLITNTQTFLANFFSDSVTDGVNNRGGIRVAAHDLDNDGHADIITSPGRSGGSLIGIFNGSRTDLVGGTLTADSVLSLFGAFTNGAYVG